MKLSRLYCCVVFTMIGNCSKAQEIAIGKWRDHLAYKSAIAVTEGGGKAYCASTFGLFSFNKKDNSLERISKISGLSDIEYSTINYNKYNKTLLIAYTNANIDLIKDNVITNIADIKRAFILGNKIINSIYFINQYAYLSCGFGIVVLDMERKEIKDTYYIGPKGGSLNIRGITSDGDNLFAATDDGVYEASLSSNLASFTSWTKHINLPKGIFNSITFFSGKIFVNYSKMLTQQSNAQDSIFVFDHGGWTHFPEVSGYNINSLGSYSDKLVITQDVNVEIFDTNLTRIKLVDSYQFDNVHSKQAVLDEDNFLWIADSQYGLVKNGNTKSSESHYPDGPETSNVLEMTLVNNNLYVAPGGRNDVWDGIYNHDGLFYFKDDDWRTIRLDTITDVVNVNIDPNESTKVYASTLSKGLLEFNNDVLTTIYNTSNSTLEVRADAPTSGIIQTAGSAFDKEGNLWITNSHAKSPLSVKKKDDSWQSYTMNSLTQISNSFGSLIVNRMNQKWIIIARGGGILVFDDNNTIPNTTDDKSKILTTAQGQGKLPSANVLCMAEDLEGVIWVGTSAGIGVFYSPENVFSNGKFDAQEILVIQDGKAQILLGTETITAIAVDGANRKWIGTQNAGVFLMSADGTTEIHHFISDNSPLLTNEITSIAINQQSGEVFFGTSKGIISYKNTATEGTEDFGNVYAYPNPVRENYEGLIAIKGLVKDVNVKITDITGTLVYETKAEGGQAIWDGKNFSGIKVHTGVYLVFCSNSDGTKTFITKILFIN